jgi:hypothetical protein
VATTDPDRAERLAQAITEKSWRDSVIAKIAEVLAATDPDGRGLAGVVEISLW